MAFQYPSYAQKPIPIKMYGDSFQDPLQGKIQPQAYIDFPVQNDPRVEARVCADGKCFLIPAQKK